MRRLSFSFLSFERFGLGWLSSIISTNDSKIHLTETNIYGRGIQTGDIDIHGVDIHTGKGYGR